MVLDLSDRGNHIAGPNNAGKSNIIRALRLALNPETEPNYNPDLDQPKQMDWARPRIRLDFEMQRKRSRYQTLLKYAKEYEESIVGENEPTFAEEGIVKYEAKFRKSKDSRQEEIRAKGSGAISGDRELREKALAKFHDSVQLVDIESGEDLDSLLQRGFNTLFTQVLSNEYSNEIDEAKSLQKEYYSFMKDKILGEMNKDVTKNIKTHSSEVTGVEFLPNIVDVDTSLADMNIAIDDAVETPLSEKGTGMRSLLIQMVMSFIADTSRRGLIFAIEEPEAFLHPEQHENLARNLESFTSKSDISLITTTHSPFILADNTPAEVFTVSKDSEGRTEVQSEDVRQLAIRNAKDLLTGSPEIPDTTGMIDSVPGDTDLILVTEGITDKCFIEAAAEKTGNEEFLDRTHIHASDGADDAAKNAVVLKEVFNETPVLVILDSDDPGKSAYSLLTDKLKFQGKKEVIKYNQWVNSKGQPVEAEDLFPEDLIEEFRDKYGEEAIDGYMKRKNGKKHIKINKNYKNKFVELIEQEADEDDYDSWCELIEYCKDAL
jgi:predicted ATP-dependent endonuclease of OLD family